MKKLMLVSLVLGACVANPHPKTTPQQRAEAISLYLTGTTTEEIGEQFKIGPNQARRLIHETIKELNLKYYSRR